MSPMTFEPARRSSVTILSTDTHGAALRTFGTAASPASTTWPTANTAYFIPFYVSTPFLAREMFFVTGTTPGTTNYDLGIYESTGATTATRLASLGSTAAVSTTDVIMPVGGGDITDTLLTRGVYFMAMNSAATTLTVRALSQAVGLFRAIGMRQVAVGATALPATVTLASIGTTNFMPIMGVTGVTNIQ